ncbi:hypothetical protein AB6A40_006618 [Gnathostoma spinigerum]|uniref:JmjC domain-containing protein n=1 Tax=Gnathostoma spinigerum TaxID=75299 RepID=A0ABD6ERJ9_9BILA
MMRKRNVSRKKRPGRRKRKESTSEEETEVSSEESTFDIEETLFQNSWHYDMKEMLRSSDFDHNDLYRVMSAKDLTIEFFRNGKFSCPLLFHSSLSELGMKMPESKSFSVLNVRDLIGGEEVVEVIDVRTQDSYILTLNDFVEYYLKKEEDRDELLNVLSLEFTGTALEEEVQGPSVVRDIDWVEKFWPKPLLAFSKSDDLIDNKRGNGSALFPKVQRYCLMSVKGCYTEFHIDFGGTSVWYHILKGSKIFWIVEPTEQNIRLYEEWILKGDSNSCFFGKFVEKCARVVLIEGDTFLIPAGWIHGVYTPEDSLAFGGNFLHSYAISTQLRVYKSEDKIKVKKRYRYPYYTQMLWYVIAHVVAAATGQEHINLKETEGNKEEVIENTTGSAKSVEDQDEKTGVVHTEEDTVINVNTLEKNLSDQPAFEIGRRAPSKEEGTERDMEYLETQEVSTIKDAETDETVRMEENSVVKEMKVVKECVIDSAFRDDFLLSMSRLECDGLFILLHHMKRLVKLTSKHESVQGLKDSDQLVLLDRLEAVLNHKLNLDREHEQCNVNQSIADMQKTVEITKSSVSLQASKQSGKKDRSETSKPPRKPIPTRKLKRKSSTKEKISKQTVTKNRKSDAAHHLDGPLIVNGLPPPIMPADAPQAPNPYNYDPMATLTPLGHKQLPSAYRRTSDMAKPPPTRKYRLVSANAKDSQTAKKPERTAEENDGQAQIIRKDSEEASSAPPCPKLETVEKKQVTSLAGGNGDSEIAEPSTRLPSNAHANAKRGRRSNQQPHRDSATTHSTRKECPEFEYRSPLARTHTLSCDQPHFERKSFQKRRFSQDSGHRLFGSNSKDIGLDSLRLSFFSFILILNLFHKAFVFSFLLN